MFKKFRKNMDVLRVEEGIAEVGLETYRMRQGRIGAAAIRRELLGEKTTQQLILSLEDAHTLDTQAVERSTAEFEAIQAVSKDVAV